MKVKLISITPNAEETMGYIARVSSPENQSNKDVSKLLAYCLKHSHWSVFEHAHATVEIETSRAISAQIIRHRSFVCSEFSQRYSQVTSIEKYPARRQDNKNRQNSIDDLDETVKTWFEIAQEQVAQKSMTLYNEALHLGVAKEQARVLLPMGTTTRLYMTGNIRSWITYIQLRSGNGTQKEHQDIAIAIKDLLSNELPTLADALGWKGNTSADG